ncbi:protein-L-isoaspartate O-methyltransferase [Kitasatospora aureofaciens]|uniref:protein-L-isoaspartate O-methyltransferase n=1 Tax=Kitasatospora aureofaciens TaxID=1894 RepID=UPI0037CBEC05
MTCPSRLGPETEELALRALAAFPEAVAREPGVHDERVLAAVGRVPRHLLVPELLAPVGEDRPARRWRLLRLDQQPAEHLAICYGTDQVVVQLEGQPLGGWRGGDEYTGVPTAQSSGIGLIALTLQELDPRSGDRVVEVGACTGYLAALAADLTGRQVTGVEIDRELVRVAVPRLAAAGADVRMVARDGLRGLPDRTWNVIAASCGVRGLPAAWPAALAPGGRLLTTVTTGAPGWGATALVRRDEHGLLSGQLTCGRWAHVPDRAAGWLPLQLDASVGPSRHRTAVLAPPAPTEYGFWVALAHLAPGVRRHWCAPDVAEDAVVLVGTDGSRAVVDRDGSRVVERGPHDLWSVAEAVHSRWAAAGRPTVYGLEFDRSRVRVVGGPALSWELPLV